MTYSHMASATLPSALRGFTSEFGKGSGGSLLLLSPANCFGFRWSYVLPLSTERVINGLVNWVCIVTSFFTKSSYVLNLS